MIRLLESQADAGVEIKVIGAMSRTAIGVEVRAMPLIRLHAQAIIRDGREVFFREPKPSQSRVGSAARGRPDHQRRRAVRSFKVIFEMDWGDIIQLKDHRPRYGESL